MKNNIKMQYPYDVTGENQYFDGTFHEIIPKDIYSIEVGGVEYFLMYYVDLKYKKTMQALLVKSGNTYIKVPLDNYDYIKAYLIERKPVKPKMKKVKIDLPSEIGCTRVQYANSLFLPSPELSMSPMPPLPPDGKGGPKPIIETIKTPIKYVGGVFPDPPDDDKDDIEHKFHEEKVHHDCVDVYVPVSANGEIDAINGLFQFYSVTEKNKYIFDKMRAPSQIIIRYALEAFEEWKKHKTNKGAQAVELIDNVKYEYEYIKKPDGKTIVVKYSIVKGIHYYNFIFSEYTDIDDISKIEDIYWLEIDPLNTMNSYLEDISYLDRKSRFRYDLDDLFYRSGKGLLPTVYADKSMVVVDMGQRRR